MLKYGDLAHQQAIRDPSILPKKTVGPLRFVLSMINGRVHLTPILYGQAGDPAIFASEEAAHAHINANYPGARVAIIGVGRGTKQRPDNPPLRSGLPGLSWG